MLILQMMKLNLLRLKLWQINFLTYSIKKPLLMSGFFME